MKFLILITVLIFNGECKLQNFSQCNFIHYPVCSVFLYPNIFLSTLFSNFNGINSSLNIRDEVSHLYKATSKFTVLYVILLDSEQEDKIQRFINVSDMNVLPPTPLFLPAVYLFQYVESLWGNLVLTLKMFMWVLWHAACFHFISVNVQCRMDDSVNLKNGGFLRNRNLSTSLKMFVSVLWHASFHLVYVCKCTVWDW
jgi:hypothetical protein